MQAFIANSRFTATHTAVPRERLSTVYLGYQARGFKRRSEADVRAHQPFTVGLIGRICESKGHYLIVEAASQLRRLGDFEFRFRFIGDAPSREESLRIRKAVSEAGVADYIEFRGYREDIGREFQEMDALAIPSTDEPFGRVLCEAAEAGIPVIAADSGGLGELCRRFGIGVRFEAGNVNDFIRKLRLLVNDYDSSVRSFKAAADRMLRSLDMSEYLRVIGKILDKAAAGESASVEWFGRSLHG